MKGYIYVGVSIAIVIIGIFLIYQFGSDHVEIQNIQVQPSIIKVGNTFTVNATLVNNSQNPIRVVVPHCADPSFVIFDNHVTIKTNEILCEDYLAMKPVNSGEKISIVYPIPNTTFRATESGTTKVTVTFSYFESSIDSHRFEIRKTVSKSFSFMILDK